MRVLTRLYTTHYWKKTLGTLDNYTSADPYDVPSVRAHLGKATKLVVSTFFQTAALRLGAKFDSRYINWSSSFSQHHHYVLPQPFYVRECLEFWKDFIHEDDIANSQPTEDFTAISSQRSTVREHFHQRPSKNQEEPKKPADWTGLGWNAIIYDVFNSHEPENFSLHAS